MSYPKQDGSGTEQGYNGWKNYETWNVALWVCNDEGLYREARRYRHKGYRAFIACLEGLGGDISFKTPDGVAWNDSGLDIDALNEMIGEL